MYKQQAEIGGGLSFQKPTIAFPKIWQNCNKTDKIVKTNWTHENQIGYLNSNKFPPMGWSVYILKFFL